MDEFLEGISLGKYKEVFLDNGVEDLETILELDEKHIEQMGVPLGHKLKMVKRIKEIRKERGLEVPQSRKGEERPNVKSNFAATDTTVEGRSPKKAKKVAFADEPNMMTGGVGTENDDRKPQSPSKSHNARSLLDGEYDEAEAHNEFLQALNAWRNAGKP